jgi:hypothetical protein
LPRTVTTDGTNLYWLTSSTNGIGALLTCAIVGCSGPSVLASNIVLAREVVVDARAIYWTDQGNPSPPTGSVWKVAR